MHNHREPQACMTNDLVQLDNIHVAFQSEKPGYPLRVLEGINLRVPERQFLSILGPSGCGKSTLLRIMAGLLVPNQGSVKWNGVMSVDFASRVAMNFQKPVLLPWLSVRQNALLPLRLANKSNNQALGTEIERRLTYLLNFTELTRFSDALPYELSVGMQMRAALVRTLITNPDLVFMDEPFSAIDEFTRQHLGLKFRSIAQGTDAATVFVTHSIQEAALLSDRIIILSPRPAHIVEDIDVGYPDKRTDTLQRSKEYLDICDHLRSVMAHG